MQFFEKKIQWLFERMRDKRAFVREGFTGVFLYMPQILKEKFQPFIKDVMENTQEFVTDENEKVSDISLRVLKILIQNYG